MARRNLQINQEEIDALIKIAERTKPHKKPLKHKDSQVERYVNENNIKSGKTKVPGYIIYYHYYEWKDQNKLTRRMFFRSFCKMFERTYIQRGTGYYLDPAPFDLTVEGFFKARALLRRQNEKSKK